MKGPPVGLALALLSNINTCLERVSKDKCSILLVLVVNNEGKQFYNVDTSSNPFSSAVKNDCFRSMFKGRGKVSEASKG
jgi:hypothetical protein